MSKNLLDQAAEELLSQMGQATDTEIMDDRPVHVIDNGAMPEIADAEPIDPEDEFFGDADVEASEPSRDEQVIGIGERIRGRTTGPFRDDFVDHVRQLSRARIGPHGELLDDFDQLSQMQGLEHQQLQEVAPFTRFSPPSVLEAVLGGHALVKLGDPAVMVARWTGPDAETLPVTVTLSPIGNADNIAGIYFPYCIVQWGTRDQIAQAEVDVGRGCQFTINASSVVLSFSLNPPSGTSPSTGTQALDLTAMLSFHPCVRTQQITRSLYFDFPGAAIGNRILVPKFAKSFTVWRSDATAAVTVRLSSYDNTVIYSISRPAAVSAVEVFMDPIILSGDVGSFVVTSAAATTVRVVFELAM